MWTLDLWLSLAAASNVSVGIRDGGHARPWSAVPANDAMRRVEQTYAARRNTSDNHVMLPYPLPPPFLLPFPLPVLFENLTENVGQGEVCEKWDLSGKHEGGGGRSQVHKD